ncbi:MAG: hypothetical protein KJN66_08800 [Bacteroidia bacterium]|nr:hypothetical protein [Bacteroidia bacterium]
MKFPIIRLPKFFNIVILVISLIIAGFTLLFGFAHIFEAIFGEPNPDIPYSESMKGWIIVISLCLIGILFLLIAFASIKGIREKINK